MKKIGIAGNIILDVVKKIDGWPTVGMLVNIREVSQAVGGCVCNTAIDLKRLDEDISVSVYGKIGNDEYGNYLSAAMQREGLDIRGVKRDDRLPTSFTDVMTLQSGERTFFQARGANAAFTEQDIDVPSLDCELFHLGYLLLLDGLDEQDEVYGTKAAKLLHDVQSRGIKTSIDLVSAQAGKFKKTVTPSLKYCDYVIINEVEGGMLTDIEVRENGAPMTERLREVCSKLLSLGVKESVTIHCPELSCAMDKTGNFSVLPSLQLPKGYIVGSVGAGDAFCAGMLYSIAREMSLLDGMRLASCAAACNLSVADSVSGARDLEETVKLEKKYKRRTT
jgi:sugar/nucleoside kinase (ribokinase family)